MMIGQKLYWAGLFLSALAAGCTSRSTHGGGTNGEPGGAGGSAPGEPAEAQLRVAHLAPNAPRVDVCLLHDSESVGPLMASNFNVKEGLDYAEVTRYQRVPSGTYTIRLVEPGSKNCEKGLAGLKDTTGVALEGKTRYTLAALGGLGATGEASAPIQMKTFTDQTEPVSGKARLRAIHAVPTVPTVDIGLREGEEFQPLFQNVKFGEIGQATGAEDGYLPTAPVNKKALVLRASGATNDLAELPGFTLRSGEVATTFIIGDPTSQTRPLDALVCADSDEAEANLSRCTHLKK